MPYRPYLTSPLGWDSIPGETHLVQQARTALCLGRPLNPSLDVHVLASLLKLWVRELAEVFLRWNMGAYV